MKFLSTNALCVLGSSPPQCLNQYNYLLFIPQKQAVLWGKADIKADYEFSLDGESFKRMKKHMGFTLCLDYPCQGHGWGNS